MFNIVLIIVRVIIMYRNLCYSIHLIVSHMILDGKAQV